MTRSRGTTAVAVPEIFVRHAEAGDEPTWRAHREEARRESSRYRGEPWSPGDDEGAEGQGSTLVLVAGVDDTVFGSVAASHGGDTRWWIDHVFVEEAAREVGLGDALMNALMVELRSRGASRLGSSAQPGDRSLKNLFERHGLVARTILVGRDLSDPSSGADASR